MKPGEGKKWLPHTLKCRGCGTVYEGCCMIDAADQLEQATNGFILANITPECPHDCPSVKKMLSLEGFL